MKQRYILILIFASMLSLGANAQLLWKISGNNLTKPSYLFGTHHVIEKEQIKNFDQILNLCGQTDATIGEIDMSDKDMQAKIMKGVIMTSGTIKDLLTDADYDFVDNEFKLLMGVGLDKLGQMKPMMLDNLFVIRTYLKLNGLTEQPKAVDMLFQTKAREMNKKVAGLETVEQQLDLLFNSLPLKRQSELLVKDIREKQKNIDLLKRLNECYMAGDLVKLEALNNDDDCMMPDEKKILIDNRNLNWIKQLPEMIGKQSCFIAVGCMHLVGDTGLIKQLKAAGYTVEPVIL